MAKQIQIKNTIYKIPQYGENRWGEETTALIEAMTEALTDVVGPEDILTREAVLSNNVTEPAIINGLRFDTSVVQSFTVNGTIVRTFTLVSAKEPKQDTFIVEGTSYAGVVEYSLRYVGSDAGVKLEVGDSGQFTYTSENDTDTESLFIKFYGRAIVEDEE